MVPGNVLSIFLFKEAFRVDAGLSYCCKAVNTI